MKYLFILLFLILPLTAHANTTITNLPTIPSPGVVLGTSVMALDQNSTGTLTTYQAPASAISTFVWANPSGIVPIANGGTGSATAQGAINNLNAYSLGSAGYVVALCTGSNDQNALMNAAIAADNTSNITSVLIPPGKAFATDCVLSNTMKLTGTTWVASFFGWPFKQSYAGDPVFHAIQAGHIFLNNGFNPGDVNVDAFTTRACFFDLNGGVALSFRDLNIVGFNSTSNGAVAICNSAGRNCGASTGVFCGESAFSLDHVGISRTPVAIGGEISQTVSATGTYTFTTNPTNGQTIILNGTTQTFVTSGATGNQTNIKGTAALTVAQLAVDLNAESTAGVSGILRGTYSSGAAGSLVLTITGAPFQANVEFFAPTAGNFYTLAAGTYGGTVSGATLTGGIDPGYCVGSLCNNVYELYIDHSAILEGQVAINGNDSDAFIRESQLNTFLYAIGGIMGSTFTGVRTINILGDRFEEIGTAPFGIINLTGIENTNITNNQFDNISAPAVVFTLGYSNDIFANNMVNGYGTFPIVVGTTTLSNDAALIFRSSTSGAGRVIVSGNSFDDFGGEPNADYLAAFEGTTDNNFLFSANISGTGAYNIAEYHFDTETPTMFVSDNLGTPHREVGRIWGLNTLSPVASSELTVGGYSTFQGGLSSTPLSLTIISTAFATNAILSNYFFVTLPNSAATTANAPSNPTDGQALTYEFTQGASGNGTIIWNSVFDFGIVGAPTLSTSAAAVDLIAFRYSARLSKWIYIGSQLGN